MGLPIIARALLFYGTRLPGHRGKAWLHGHLRRLLRVSLNEELVVDRNGLRWSLNPSDFPHSSLFWLGTYDPYDYEHARRLLKPGAVIFDVGANFGFYSLKLASDLGEPTRVHSFEPNPPTLARLRKNIELNSLGRIVQTHGVALSDAAGEATIATKSGNSGWARLTSGGSDGERASLVTMDDFVRRNGVDRLDFIKIDVEGFEAQVLRGGAGVLERLRPVILIELNPDVLREQGSSLEAVISLLESKNYRLLAARRDKLVPLGTVPEGGFVNAFAVPAERPLPQ